MSMPRPLAVYPRIRERPPRSDAARRLALHIVTMSLVVSSVSWRQGDYFSGGLDPVVLGKAFLSVVSLFVALGLAQSGARRRLGTASLWWLGIVLGCTAFGAYVSGTFVAGLAVAVRVALLGAAVFFLLRSTSAEQVLASLCRSCGAVGAVAAITGIPVMVQGRLGGGIPAVDPNELALLIGVAVVYIGWRTVLGTAGWRDAVATAFYFAVMWATGSRTGLIMMLAGLAVMALYIRRPRIGLVVGGLVLVAVSALALATGVVADFAQRGSAGTSTLDSRFIAWRAALTWADSWWQQAFGGGLTVKVIRVKGQYWATQPLDNSWMSLLVEGGLLGLAVAALWVLWTLRGALRAPRSLRVFFLGLLVFIVGRSTLESGLFDATPAFLLFLAVSLLGEPASRERLREEAPNR